MITRPRRREGSVGGPSPSADPSRRCNEAAERPRLDADPLPMLRRSVPSELTFIRAVHRLARDLLVARGVDVTYRGVHGLIWREGDDVRTFVASLYNPRAGVVRLHVDHLSIRRPWKNETAHPTRNKSEISILPCEILAMLPWALGLSSVEPSIAIDGKGTWIEHREYAWSRRAAHTHDADVRNRRGRTA